MVRRKFDIPDDPVMKYVFHLSCGRTPFTPELVAQLTGCLIETAVSCCETAVRDHWCDLTYNVMQTDATRNYLGKLTKPREKKK